MFAPLLALALASTPVAAPTTLLAPAGQLALEAGVLSPPLAGAPADAALRYALARRAVLGLPAAATLVAGPLFGTRFGGSVHLLEQVGGITVHGGKVIVTLDEAQRVVRVASSLRPFTAVDLGFKLDGPAALALASKQIDGALLKPDGTPFGGHQKTSFLVGDALHAGFLVYVPTLKVGESWHVAIDATNGAVLYTEDRARAAVDAKVYASSPGGLSAGVGIGPTTDVQLPHLLDNDGGFLRGEFVQTLNCCPTLDCDMDAGAPSKRAVGTMQTFGGTFTYDMAICDQRPRATNDVAVHPSGDYVYTPVDPPLSAVPSVNTPPDYDEFAEVNAYFHVSKTYDFLRSLSVGPLTADGGFTPFHMRDPGNGRLPLIWVNASDADYSTATRVDGGIVGNRLARVDNAMFVAREYMDQLSVPDLKTDTDTLVIYQGDKGDFAYDGPVASHEFGHGVIQSTANWDQVVNLDSRSANNESSALNEGCADIIAAITYNDPVVGAYVGPRTDPSRTSIRNIDNSDRCPDVLWGESHQDSLHFTGAVWEGRTSLFMGTDSGRTFDAAFFAALVSFPPDVNFEKAANIISAQVGQAFPLITDAQDKMKAVFTARGVLACSKVLDVTVNKAPRTYYSIPGTTFLNLNANTAVPGPYQFKIHVPNGAKSVSITGPYFAGGGTTPTVRIRLLAKSNAPITFTRSGLDLTNDSDVTVVPTVPSQGVMEGKAAIAVPCGGDVYFTVANTSGRDRQMFDLAFSFEQADTCVVPEPDAGQPEPPVEPQEVRIWAAPEALGAPLQGCGCNQVPPGMALFALALLARRRRQR